MTGRQKTLWLLMASGVALALWALGVTPYRRVRFAMHSTAATDALSGDRYEEAEAESRVALYYAERLKTDTAVDLALRNLTQSLLQQEKLEEAEPLLRRSVEVSSGVHGAENPLTAEPIMALGRLYELENKLSEAEAQYRRGVSIYERHSLAQKSAWALELLSSCLASEKKHLEAADSCTRILAIRQPTPYRDDSRLRRDLELCARLLRDANRVQEAGDLEQRAQSLVVRP